MKKIVSALLVFTLLFTGSFIGISNTANAAQDTTAVTTTTATEDEEMRGIWVSFKDYESLGMVNKNEKIYIKNVKKFVKTAKKKKFNTIFLHVRAYDDAIWMSDTFAASEYLTKKASRSKTAAETYSYDPLEDFIEVAAAYGLEVHAWLNPYRVTDTMYLNPAKKTNMNRVKTAVKELMEYDIAGIHFDDYFYHSQGGYISSYKSTDVYSKDITAKKKRINVNKLVKSVYKLVHKNNLVFGISPQGNFDNDMNSGADVESWLSKDGYVDYVAPQIYWTDQYSSSANVTMYSDRLAQFCGLRTNENVKLYIGLALYRTGTQFSYDPGWARSSKNLASQIKKLRASGCEGYIMFSARYLYLSQTKAEQKNFLKVLK